MDYIKDLLEVYKKAGKDTLNVIIKTPLLILLPLIYSFAYGIIQVIAFQFGVAYSRFWGIIVGLIEAMLLSSYFSQMDDGINYSRLSLNKFQDGFFAFIWNIYFMKFIFYIASLFLGPIVNMGYVALVSFILFNAAGEAIYIRNVQREDVFLYPLNYLKDNWHIWIPHALFFIFVLSRGRLGVYTNPLSMYLTGHGLYINDQTLMLIIWGIYFVFRGVLFKNTYNSTIRKRKYMGWY